MAINRLIRSNGSWSGREPDTFYLNLGQGKFIELSGVTGLEFIEDGRSYAVLDFDNDGDLDLIVKFRNAPQLRLLRNDTPTTNHSIAFRLTGRESNRDAVGALVEVETPQGKRVKQVALGSGFLSQSSLTLTFGLHDWARPVRARIVWPSGRQQVLEGLPADHRIAVTEGEEAWQAAPFRPRNSDQRVCAPQAVPKPSSSPEGVSFLSAVPAPPFSLQDLARRSVASESLRGRPTAINFWATWCAPCQEEMKLWVEHYQQIRAAGGELVAISVDEPQNRSKVEQFARERQLPFPVLLMDAATLERYNVFYQTLFERSGDMEIPTTFLLNSRGEVAKLYRGVVPVEVLLRDLRAVDAHPERIAQAALPYTGRSLAHRMGRDYSRTGSLFYLRGLFADAAFYLQQAVQATPLQAEAWSNLGVLYGRQDEVEKARQAFERAVELSPAFSEAWFNLGKACARLGDSQRAEQALARAHELDPANPQNKLEYALALGANGKSPAAAALLEEYVKQEPGDALAHNYLGVLYAQSGALALAVESFVRATELDSGYAEAFRNLGIGCLEQGLLTRATEALERALALNPQDADAAMALAEAYLGRGLRPQGEAMLRRVLELRPDDSRAREALQRLQQGGSQP